MSLEDAIYMKHIQGQWVNFVSEVLIFHVLSVKSFGDTNL